MRPKTAKCRPNEAEIFHGVAEIIIYIRTDAFYKIENTLTVDFPIDYNI